MISHRRRQADAFSERFETADECEIGAFDEGLERLSSAVVEATDHGEPRGATEQSWRERVRAGVVALLGFFDDEPECARILLPAPPGAAAAQRDRRQRLYNVLGELLDDRRHEGQGAGAASLRAQPLTAELVIGGVLSLIAERLSDPHHCPLVELAPSLISFISTSYPGRATDSELVTAASPPAGGAAKQAPRPSEVPVRATHRTACVLRAIAAAPRSSNRAIAQAAGLADEGQTSKLLGRLERRGVIENVGLGAAYGEPNAWRLTAYGQRTVEAIGHGFAIGAAPQGRRRTRGAAG